MAASKAFFAKGECESRRLIVIFFTHSRDDSITTPRFHFVNGTAVRARAHRLGSERGAAVAISVQEQSLRALSASFEKHANGRCDESGRITAPPERWSKMPDDLRRKHLRRCRSNSAAFDGRLAQRLYPYRGDRLPKFQPLASAKGA